MYKSAISFSGGALTFPLATSMFMINSMLLWWTLDIVPLLLVIKAKVVKKALPWRSKLRTKVQIYVN